MSLYNLTNITPIKKLSQKSIRRISIAASIAEESDFTSSKRLGAYLEYKGSRFNASNNRSTRFGNISYISLHAEVNVLLKALRSREKNANLKTKLKLPPSTVYVVRIMKKAENLPDHRVHYFGISKPCINCQKHLYKHNVIKIYYTDIIDNEEVLCEMRITI